MTVLKKKVLYDKPAKKDKNNFLRQARRVVNKIILNFFGYTITTKESIWAEIDKETGLTNWEKFKKTGHFVCKKDFLYKGFDIEIHQDGKVYGSIWWHEIR